jgi:hypothetical protein
MLQEYEHSLKILKLTHPNQPHFSAAIPYALDNRALLCRLHSRMSRYGRDDDWHLSDIVPICTAFVLKPF